MRYLFGERLYKETLLARPEIKATDILTLTIPMGYINSSTLSWSVKLYENTYNITIETSLDNGETWRPQLPGEQIPGLADVLVTTPTKILIRAIVDTTNTVNPADITDITLYIDYPAIGGHYAICSDGRAYFNGQEISGEPEFINLSNGTLKIKGGRKVDELYVTPRLLTKEEIDILRQTQYELQDPRESIDAGYRKISHLSGEIDADGHTIYASIHGQNKIVAHYGIDTETGDRGLFIYDIDEQGNPVEVGFTGRRGDGTVVGFGGGDADTLGGVPAEEFIEAKDYLNIAKPPIAIKKGDVYFPFENSLYSTQGTKPLPGYVATLLPEGGVAVDKPTTNYTDAKTAPTLLVPADWGVEQLGPYKWKIYAKKDNPGVGQYDRVAFFAGQYGAAANEPVTHSAYVIKNTDNLYVNAVGFGNLDVNKDGNRIWRTIAHTDAWTHRQAVVCTNPSQIKIGDYIIVDMPQLEASSHPTAFVDGSRPVGQLSYPGDKINIDHTTWHFEWKPFQDTNSMTGQVTYPVIFAVGGYSRNSMVLWFYNRQIELLVRGATTEETWSSRPIWVPPSGWYQPGKKYKVTVQIIDKDTFKVFIDGQKIIETTISDPFTASVVNQKISVGNFNTSEGFANAVYYNLRMVHDRYVSEEEILTWHSLDVPFYDFSENPLVSNSMIVEEGSNENGRYIRWENGIQMCGRRVNLDFTTTDVQEWSYPASFTQVYFGTCSPLRYGTNNDYRDALSSLVLWAHQSVWRIRLGKTSTIFHPDVGLFTLGRWK